MIATVEKPDGTYEKLEMGEPECGDSFCDQCYECIACGRCELDYCGYEHWVIYLHNPRNPYRKQEKE